MKRWLTLLLCLLAAAGILGWAAAEEDALELTADCEIRLVKKSNPKNLADRKFTTYAESTSVKNPTLTVTSETPVCGLYLCFQKILT